MDHPHQRARPSRGEGHITSGFLSLPCKLGVVNWDGDVRVCLEREKKGSELVGWRV